MSTGLSQGKTGTDQISSRRNFFKEAAAQALGAVTFGGCMRKDMHKVSMPKVHNLTLEKPLSTRDVGDVVTIDVPRAEYKFPPHKLSLSGILGLEVDKVYLGAIWSDEKLVCEFISDRKDIKHGQVLAVVKSWSSPGGNPWGDKILDLREISLKVAGIYPEHPGE